MWYYCTTVIALALHPAEIKDGKLIINMLDNTNIDYFLKLESPEYYTNCLPITKDIQDLVRVFHKKSKKRPQNLTSALAKCVRVE